MKPVNGAYKAINRAVTRALRSYRMIEDGDRILVGISGGKDSLSLLWSLADKLPRSPAGYALFPVYIDPGFGADFIPRIRKFCDALGFPLQVEYTDYGVRAHSPENRENPCFLCSRLRRKRLFEVAESLGCRKIALGHHKDDIIETFLMNICYAGEVSTMAPCQSFFDDRFRIIRPLAFAEEDLIRRFSGVMDFPEALNPCPSATHSKRREVKDMLNHLYRGNRKVRGNIFRALSRVTLA
ncbi:MAG: ATP-binding protein [Desulfobacterales bacterium]